MTVLGMLRESREENKEIIEILRRRNPNPPEVRIETPSPFASFAEDAVKVAVEDIRTKTYDITGTAERQSLSFKGLSVISRYASEN